jgi:hypothetical protein
MNIVPSVHSLFVFSEMILAQTDARSLPDHAALSPRLTPLFANAARAFQADINITDIRIRAYFTQVDELHRSRIPLWWKGRSSAGRPIRDAFNEGRSEFELGIIGFWSTHEDAA